MPGAQQPWSPGTHVVANRSTWGASVQIAIYQLDMAGRCSMASIEMREAVEGQELSPAITLNPNQAQELIDSLWQAGLRPTEGTGSAGSLKATENHLADMRKIAFKLLEEPTERTITRKG
jgi:hypothetical protein